MEAERIIPGFSCTPNIASYFPRNTFETLSQNNESVRKTSIPIILAC
jgi:hypothetical protein